MRQLQEIENEIKTLEEQIRALNAERNERMFADFCEKHGVKSGDIVELNTKAPTQLQIVDMDYHYTGWVRCHKIKKNGEPYGNLVTVLVERFDGCKVIKSMGE